MSKEKMFIGWSRDAKGIVVNRMLKDHSNTITSFSGAEGRGKDNELYPGMATTVQYLLEYEDV